MSSFDTSPTSPTYRRMQEAAAARAAALPALGIVQFPARIGEEIRTHTSFVVRPVHIDTRAGLIRFHAQREPMALGTGPIVVLLFEPLSWLRFVEAGR